MSNITSTDTELETRAVTEIETAGGNLDVGPSPALATDLQTFYASHTTTDAVKLARDIAEKLCDDGYHEASEAWDGFADSMEALSQFSDIKLN